jgi:Protein of unknown function DUF262/Protein of unknown function (DUF1524)
MTVTHFNTKNDTYRKLMGNGLIYRIPPFQRDYSWTEEEWEDLWLDILDTIAPDGEPAHYMGYLVLQSDDDKVFDVIDGQQRLTTLSLIILATLKQLQALIQQGIEVEKTQQRLIQLRQTYVGYLDPVTLIARSKLSLNRNNDSYYQTYLVPLADTLPQRGFRSSEQGLRKAFLWFEQRLIQYVKKQNQVDDGLVLAQFIDRLSDRLFFTVITVTDELNAYRVFETLNARGVRLSATDLLKNYLFSVLDRSPQPAQEIKALEDRWELMVGRLGSESFPEFLRIHWNSRHRFVRQVELFKTIRGSVRDRAQAFTLLREMDEDIEVYLGLTQPELSGWSRSAQESVSLLSLFRVRQPFPLLLAAYRCLPWAEFETLLRICVVVSFRYTVIGSLPPSEPERIYNQIAKQLSEDVYTKANQVIHELREIYPKDDSFRIAFANKIIRTKQSHNARIVRYILCQLERQATETDYDFDSQTFNIEHILPQNPTTGWESFSDEAIEALTYRLGNMALCEVNLNRNLSNDGYATKRNAK